MRTRCPPSLVLLLLPLLALAGTARAGAATGPATAPVEHRYLYVAVPGIRDYLEFGGHGVLVFDVEAGHRFVRRIPAVGGVDAKGKPLNVKGICASAATGRLYVSTTAALACYDLATDKPLWERAMPGGCDRMSITPDGKTLYLPSLEGPHWNVVDAATGEVVTKIVLDSGSHNTVVGLDGRRAYLAGLRSPLLQVADTATNRPVLAVGPFSKPVRPFTVNGAQTLVFACVNDLLGFEVGDLRTGKVLHRVTVDGFSAGPVKRHGCPSHGVGLTPDERELWLCDGHNQMLHVFDATAMPPKLVASVAVRDQPGWVTFGLDGRYAYPSTGEVLDVRSRRVVTTLADETGAAVHSEKMVEVDVAGGKVVRAGDQFGLGRAR